MELIEIFEWVSRTLTGLLLIVAGIALFRKHLAAHVRFYLWLVSLVAIVLSLFLTDWLPGWQVLPAWWESSSPVTGETATARSAVHPELHDSFVLERGPAKSAVERTPFLRSLPWWAWLWAAGTTLLWLRLLISIRYLHRHGHNVAPEHPGAQRLRTLQKALAVSQSVRLVFREGSPMTWGILRPTISLPRESETWEKNRLDLALRHELAHIKRRDLWWLFLTQVLLALFWFHPGLWFISRRLRITREEATDDQVLKSDGVDAGDYASVVLSFSKMPRAGEAEMALCGIAESSGSRLIGNRVSRILSGESTGRGKSRAWVISAISSLLFGGFILVLSVDSAEKADPVTVILDPGHGAHDNGAKGLFGIEKNYNLDVSLRTKAILAEQGFHVVMTREHDIFLSLDERLRIASAFPDSIYVSIHHNSSADRSASGVECIIPEGNDQLANLSHRLGESLKDAIVTETGAIDRGMRQSPLKAVNGSLVPAALIECGFVTHAKEARKLAAESYRESVAKGIATGISEYLKDAHRKSNRKASPSSVQKKPDPATQGRQPATPSGKAAGVLADGFDFPVGAPDGQNYIVNRGFEPNGHLGEDWNGQDGNDRGDPVTCIADGTIVLAEDRKMGWGNVVISRHRYREADGSIKTVDALYGHLDRIDVKKGDIVKRGQNVGTIGRGHRDMYVAHLHFEIRKNPEIMMDRLKFPRDHSHYHSPRAFIKAHRPK